MAMHPLAPLFAGAEEVADEIARRRDDGVPVDPTRTVPERLHAHLDLTVAEVRTETATAATLRLRRTGGGELPPFLAGQYINLFVTAGRVATSRPYAISSSPSQRDAYDLTVRRVPGGRVSNHLIDRVRVGDRLSSTAPMGTFHHNPLFHDDDVVFLAGGSGVAPAMAMLRDIAEHHPERSMHLVYGSRTDDDVIFRDAIEALAATHPRLRVALVVAEPTPGYTGRTGLLTAETISQITGPLAGRMVYVCGPQAMYAFVLDQLARLGHPRRRIRFEANGAPDRPESQRSWPAHLDPDGEVTVRIAGGSPVVCPRRKPLIDSLEEAGVCPPVGCRSGECGLCRVRVRGEVHHAQEALLRMSDVQFGYAHACVAYPMTDVDIDA